MPGAERYAFSDAVAAYCRIFGYMDARDPSVLQRYGTSVRATDADVWVRTLAGLIADHRPPVAVVTGVRYPNELQMIRDMGGVLVAVDRVEAPALTDRDPNHPVERGIADLVQSADVGFWIPELAPTVLEDYFDAVAEEVVAKLSGGEVAA